MVALGSHLLWFLSFTAVGICTPVADAIVRRDVEAVKASIADISAKTQALDAAITAFPLQGGNLLDALGIHNRATALISTLDSATTTVIATGPVSDTDGVDILEAVAAFEPYIQHALTEIVVKKPAFQALPIGGLPALIRQDLNGLKASTVGFADGLVDNAPEFSKGDAAALRDGVVAAFDVAIAGYAA